MPRYRLALEYDGAPYQGFQRQRHGPSVQQALEDALAAFAREEARVVAAGRTDTGVHAMAMTAHVDLERIWEPFRLMEAWNAHLAQRGDAVALLSAAHAEPGFHARFSCIGRAYRYHVAERRAPLVLQARAWRWPGRLDLDAMREAAALLVGRHDFTAFRHARCQAASPVRTLDRLDIGCTEHVWGRAITIEAEARSFLHHQVRSMTGALAHVGAGRCPPAFAGQLLASRDRAALPVNAPPHGLHFLHASYPCRPG